MIDRFLRTRLDPIDGKVVLITGGSKGLGLLLAREFGRLGGRTIILARDRSELELAKRRLADWGVRSDARVCDLRDRAGCEALVRELDEEYGGIDILVNNAGVIEVAPLATLNRRDFEDAIDTMFWGVVEPTLLVLEGMRRRKSGQIVNITSIGGKVSFPHLLPYNSAKFAVVGFSEGLRAELAGSGISVVTVVPGFMRTGSFLNAIFKGSKSWEFSWFSLGASLPLISTDAERAARRIVRAARADEAELILTPLANFGARFNGLFPGITTRLMSIVARLLPTATPEDTSTQRGDEVMRNLDIPMVKPALTLGMRAARELQPIDDAGRLTPALAESPPAGRRRNGQSSDAGGPA